MPDDIKVSYELDQSRNVSASLQAVLREAALGALLTGLMVLVFLRDWRSAGIVVVTIPIALLAAVIALWGAGQTINVMTLGGLALAVGILVDEATVAIENIHTHLARGVPVARGVLDASGEVVVPRLLAMLSVVAVFVPSFFMTGVSRSLFVPLSLAVGFSMIASFFLSSSLVPVLSVWLLGNASRRTTSRVSTRMTGSTDCGIASASFCSAWLRRAGSSWRCTWWSRSRSWPWLAARLGREIFPAGGRQSVPAAIPGAGGDQVRVDRTAGDRRARRNQAGRRAEQRRDHPRATSGYSPRRIRSTRSFCGPAARTKACCRWRSGRRRAFGSTDFEEALRRRFSERFPTAQFSFEPGDIVNRIMNFGTSTPVEVAVTGPDFAASRTFAAKVRDELARIPALRDLQYGQALDYPAIQVDVNRQMAGQLGLTVDQIGRSFAAATSSSRFVAPNYWADPRTGIAFQVQVEVPQPRMTTPRRSARRAGERRSRVSRHARRRRADRQRHDRRRIRSHQRAADGHADRERRRAGSGPNGRPGGCGDCPRGHAAARRGGRRPRPDRRDARDLHQHHRRTRRGGRRHLPPARRQLSVAAARVRRRLDGAGRSHGRRADAGGRPGRR